MKSVLILCMCALMLVQVGCAAAPDSAAERMELERAAYAALMELKQINPATYNAYDQSAVGVAVFPNVGKGGLIVGGAYGQGVLFEQGEPVGYVGITQGTIGAQIGGQAFREVIFINDPAKLADLKAERLELAAQATAVAITADASANANYDNGVAIITFGAKGAMAEATVGGQAFEYVPKAQPAE